MRLRKYFDFEFKDERDETVREFILLVFYIILFTLTYYSQLSNLKIKLFSVEFISPGFTAGNVLRYLLVLAISFVGFLLISSDKFSRIKNDRIRAGICILTLFFMFGYLYVIYKSETIGLGGYGLNKLLRQQIRFKFYTYVGIILLSFLVVQIVKNRAIRDGYKKVIRVSVAMVTTLISSALLYESNIFKDTMGEYIHTHLFLNTIIKVANAVPYNIWNHDVYGHYGLIYYPFVKLLGNDTNAIMLTISISGGIIIVLTAYIINLLTNNDFVYVAGILAVGRLMTVEHPGGNYYPIFPHRIMFPVVAVFIVLLEKNYSERKRIIVDLLFAVLAITWNFETGLISILVVIAVNTMDDWRWELKKILITIIRTFGIVAGSIAISYILVNIYNVICGGYWESFNDYLYPLSFGGEVTALGSLTSMFRCPDSSYMLYVFAFSVIIFPVIKNQVFKSKGKMNNQDRVISATCCSGLMALVYFMNRQAAMNIYISYVQFVIILVFLTDYYMTKGNALSLKAFWSTLLVVLALEGSISIVPTIRERINQTWDKNSFESELNQYKEWYNKDSIACGAGVPEMYYQMGIDPGIYLQDSSDIDKYGRKYFAEELKKHDTVIIESQFPTFIEKVQPILDDQNFVPIRSFNGELIHMTEYQRKVP